MSPVRAALAAIGPERPAAADHAAPTHAAPTQAALAQAAEHAPQGLCFFDTAGRLLASNRRYAEIYHLLPEQLRPGMTLHEMIELCYRGEACPRMTQDEYLQWRSRLASSDMPSDGVVELRNGRTIFIRHAPVADRGWVATHEDITHRSRNEAQMAFLARHDALTGLPNRLLFRERLNAALAGIASGAAAGAGVAVLCLDLDRFKAVNDLLGHPIGDMLLRQVADRIATCVREDDTVARLGGDEFAVIQNKVDGPEAAAALAQRVIDELRAPFMLDGHKVLTNTSIGVALAPWDGTNAGKMLKNADLALYQAKSGGRGTFRFFRPEMDAAQQQRRALERDLQRGLDANEFELLYQPQVELGSGRIVGLEALVRWNHPKRGVVAPADFIAVAEESGLVVPLGRWVLERACRDAARWADGPRVAVNLSAAQFRDAGLAASVTDALEASGLPATRLELEINEAILLRSDAATLDALRGFRALGIQIAMDDFGSGTASLGFLRKYPFNRVKIDPSFARDLTDSRETEAMLAAITRFAAILGLATTAEGVETQEQLDRLRAAGCLEGQGHLFSHPLPSHAIPTLLHHPSLRG